jgi:serine/threonine-protein kinase PknG
VAWYRGLGQLVRGEAEEARASFWKVYEAVPGELAPKLALGIALETAGDLTSAARWYASVTLTDPTVTSAAFGLARCLLSSGDRSGAIAAYERIPDSSSGYLDAQSARIHCLTSNSGAGGPTLDDVLAAGAVLDRLPIDGEQRDRLSADLLKIALRLATSGDAPLDSNTSLLGCPLAERELRLALEAAYRNIARRAPTRAERIYLIDEANHARPRTWT